MTRCLKEYEIKLGFAPEGHKQIEGDGRTPEGVYRIDRRNPNSQFHLSLGISYPNEEDIAWPRGNGEVARRRHLHPRAEASDAPDKGDWTWGCIAVDNEEIEDIYAMVEDGTPIAINP